MNYTLRDIINLYKKTFYTEDDGSIAFIASIIIGSRSKAPPVWSFLIGPSSGGKSELISSFSKASGVTQVSDLTPNTFLSGFNSSKKEASLLKKLGLNFVVTMKDFTTILSKPLEAQTAIIAQMREIYDGHFKKETGTGDTLEWGGDTQESKGKATFIMAATEAVYSVQEKFSEMGTRAVNYVLKPQDRKLTTKRALNNSKGLDAKKDHIQSVFAEFCDYWSAQFDSQDLPELAEDLQDEIIEVADFSTICRSVVKRDYKGAKSLALSPEMPMRISKELQSTAQILTAINGGVLEPYLKDIVFKIAFDSIPKQRRLVLEALATYDRVSVSGVGDLINYSPERAKEWIEDLNMFDVAYRIKAKNKQYWRIKDEHRETLKKYLNVKPKNEDLESEEETGNDDDYYGGEVYSEIDVPYDIKEENKEIAKSAEIDFNKL